MKTLLTLFLTFLKVGTFTFGGGLAMLPVIRNEAVKNRGWMTDGEITDCFAVAQSLPGVVSVNAAIYVGNKVKGPAGALFAATGVMLPAFVSILLILIYLEQFERNVYIQGAFEGIKAATVGLILVTVFKMGKNILKVRLDYVIAAVSFIMIVVFQLNAIAAIVFGGLAGLISYWIRRKAT